MRDTHNKALKRIKQQIIAFCTGHRLFSLTKSNWTVAHLKWLKDLKFNDPVEQESLNEYLSSLTYLSDKIKALDVRIEELASEKQYCENVKKLRYLKGIDTNRLHSITSDGSVKIFDDVEEGIKLMRIASDSKILTISASGFFSTLNTILAVSESRSRKPILQIISKPKKDKEIPKSFLK